MSILILMLVLLSIVPPAWGLTPSGPITVSTSNAVIEGLAISGSGDCVTITGGATNITIRANEIGPCTGNGIRIVNGTNHKIYDNYIHPERRPSTCCDTGDGVFVDGASGVEIQGNVICFGEANIVTQSATTVAHGNYLCNPQGNTTSSFGGGRGQNFHATTGSSSTTVTSNYIYSCERAADGLGGTTCPTSPNYPMSAHQEDSINFYNSSNGLIQNNYVIGGTSTSGTAMIADGIVGQVTNNLQFRNNIIHNTAHAGVAVTLGSGHVIDGNKIQNACLGGWDCTNDTAISAYDGLGVGCGPVQVTNNIADQTRPANNSVHAGYWGGDGGCNTGVSGDSCCNNGGTTLSGNTFDAAAFAILNPIETTNPPPAIPPVPKNCVAVSPYSTNTSLAVCGAAPVAVPTVLRLVR